MTLAPDQSALASTATARSTAPDALTRTDRVTRAGVAGAVVGFAPFLLVLWDVGVRPLRRINATGVNVDFFDLQARALFHGNLDVPPGSLGVEAFVVDGRHHMYFGLFPALLRMPVLLLTDRLDGRLTALSMLVGWIVLAAAMTVLVRRVRGRLRGDAPVRRFEAVGLAAIVATVTGGSTVVYLASQPWVYHEVYVWSTALTVATVASLIATWDDPSGRRIVLTTILALATMLTRITAGWAMAVAVLATGIWFLVSRRRRSAVGPVAGWRLVAGGTAVVLIGTLVNWAKFRHPYLFPIEDQVWTQYSAHRRVVVAANGGGLEGLQFVPTTLSAYLRPNGVRFGSVFPFITPPTDPPAAVGDVLLDESWRTGSVPALMPLLFLLTLWGFVVAMRDVAAAALRVPLIACAAMTGGVIAFAHVAQRYTSEFVPLLALGATIGFVDIARRLRPAGVALKRSVLTVVWALAVFGIAAHASIGLVSARQHWRGERLEDLVALQVAVADATGREVAERVRFVAALPARGGVDELAVVGDCDAVYLGTGEIHGSWIPVEHRARTFRIDVADTGVRPGTTSLMWFSGHVVRRLHVQANREGRLRLVMIGASPDTSGLWLDTAPGDTIDVAVTGDTEANRFVATATVASGDRQSIVTAPMSEWNHQFRTVPVVPTVALSGAVGAERIGTRIAETPGSAPDLCDRLR
jgi:hypothetical protein